MLISHVVDRGTFTSPVNMYTYLQRTYTDMCEYHQLQLNALQHIFLIALYV